MHWRLMTAFASIKHLHVQLYWNRRVINQNALLIPQEERLSEVESLNGNTGTRTEREKGELLWAS